MVKAFSKMYNFLFFGKLFLQTFLLYNWILRKKNKKKAKRKRYDLIKASF